MTQVGTPIFWTEITLRRHLHALAPAAAIENRDDQGDSWVNPTLAKIFAGQIAVDMDNTAMDMQFGSLKALECHPSLLNQE